MDEYIKSCPFCGGEGCLYSNYSRYGKYLVFVKCEDCFSQGKSFASRENPAESDWQNQACEDAIKHWNRREVLEDK